MSNAGWIPFRKAGLGFGLHRVQGSAKRQASIIENYLLCNKVCLIHKITIHQVFNPIQIL
jgi:hypothetical protein